METADILRATFRHTDILGRIGGDEFAVLAAIAENQDMNTLVTRLQTKLAARNTRANRSYGLSLSIGLARYGREAPRTLAELMTQADEAMYAQKRLYKRRHAV